MITRRSIEEAIALVLERAGIANVRRQLDERERNYPLVAVLMTAEDNPFPRSPSTIDLTISVESQLAEGWEKNHYDLHEKILKTLSVEEKVFRKVNAVNPRIISWINSEDSGTMEIQDDEGLPLARSEITCRLIAV